MLWLAIFSLGGAAESHNGADLTLHPPFLQLLPEVVAIK